MRRHGSSKVLPLKDSHGGGNHTHPMKVISPGGARVRHNRWYHKGKAQRPIVAHHKTQKNADTREEHTHRTNKGEGGFLFN